MKEATTSSASSDLPLWNSTPLRSLKVQVTASSEAPQLSALVTTPLFHVTANNCLAQSMTLAGGKLVHMYKWDAGEALRLIERERITNMTGVPTMARELIAHPDFEKRDTSTLKSLGGGGAQLQPVEMGFFIECGFLFFLLGREADQEGQH